ncbi:hypothetical protein ABTX15_24305 [Micromonospora sp. NPDC094482]|uniref:hypothetical protein n=1 Tax=unclassified Micromonospora TaxID=2617518 RepID=UPI0033266153
MTHIARRRMLAGVAAGLLTASLGVATGSGAASAESVRPCSVSPLPYPADSYRASADAIAPTGRFIAGSGLRTSGPVNEPLLLIWEGFRLTTVVSPLAETVVDVNNDGVVVGYGWVNGFSQPWRYRDGRVQPLPVPAGSEGTVVTAINTAGDVVGHSNLATTGEFISVIWPAARPGTVEVLDAPAGAMAVGIIDDRTIVGTAGYLGASTGWIRHPDGRLAELTMPDSLSTTVNGAGGHWAIGLANQGGSNSTKVRWDLRTGVGTALDPRLPVVSDVNAAGVVVGGDRLTRGGGSVLLPGGGTGVGVGARAIADNGVVVGFRNNDGDVRPIRWIGC